MKLFDGKENKKELPEKKEEIQIRFISKEDKGALKASPERLVFSFDDDDGDFVEAQPWSKFIK